MRTIEREELKNKIDRGDDFRLVMTLGAWAFRAAHLPGSLHFDSPEAEFAALDPEDEILPMVETSLVQDVATIPRNHRRYGRV